MNLTVILCQVPGVLRTSSGKPGEVICNIAEEESAVMIITGTRGMGKVRRTILGSVSDFLVNHAVCPVMVCRDPAEIERQRRPSGTDASKKLRHASGDSLNSFTANLRQRFASGGKSRSQSQSSDKDDKDKEKKENKDPKLEEEAPPEAAVKAAEPGSPKP